MTDPSAPPVPGGMRLPAFSDEAVDEAVRAYHAAGLYPILIHAPIFSSEPPSPTLTCTCGQEHKSSGKHPIAKNWQKPADLDELQNQIARLKFKPNVGIILGPQQHGEYLVAIDVDDEARFAKLCEELGALPETARCDSGRGYRLLYEVGPDVATGSLKNVTGMGGEPGVDVKVSGGQIVVAPSWHPSGKRYAWSRFGEIARLPPAWVLELVERKPPAWVREYTPQTMREDARAKKKADRYLEKAVADDVALIASCGEGVRNTTLHKRAVALFSLCAGMFLGGKWDYVQTELYNAGRKAGLPERETRTTIASAEKYVRESGAVRVPLGLASPSPASSSPPDIPEYAPPPADARLEIKLRADSAVNVDLLDEALSKVAPDVFQRALQLVEIVPEKKPTLSPIGAPVLRSLTQYSLETHVSRNIRCLAWKAEEGWTPVRAKPDAVILPMLHYGRWKHIPPVVGITESPLFRPDGTVMQKAGYDAETGYLYRPSCEYLPVPEHPTQEDARRALGLLQHVFCDFPYTSPASGMVPIAALLTILARSAIDGNVPVFVFEASIQGAGKTLQADCVHIIATGRLGLHASFPHDEEEQRKAILSCALSASPVAFFDNIKGVLGGEAIEGAITTGELKQRILGRSEDVSVAWIAVVIVTGNNMTMTEDMLRRSLMCRIEPPERRAKFQHPELTEWVKEERAKLIVAALTILRAYACKGYPDAGAGVMPSFNAWSKLIPQAIVFAGGANVLDAIGSDEKTGSDDAAAFATIVRDLPRISSGTPLTAKQLLDRLYPAPRRGEPPDGWDNLREAIEVLCPARGPFPPDPKRLGMALRQRLGQVRGGLKLSSSISRTDVRTWYVEKIEDPS